MKMITAFCCFLLLIFAIPSIQAQHEIETEVLKHSGTAQSCFQHLTRVGRGVLKKDEMILKRLDSGQSGYLEFSIQHFVNVDIHIGLELEDASATRFSFHFLNGEVWIGNTNYGTCGNGSNYRIERCDTSVKFFRDGELFSEQSTVDNLDDANAFVEVEAADLYENNTPSFHLAFPYLNSCTSTEGYVATTNYPDLQKRPDGSFVYLTGPALFFRYYEDYAIIPGQNDQLDYTIYRENGLVKSSGTLDKVSGENKMVIGLTSFNEMYMLEVTDSKGEKQYLRFLYYCANPPNCPISTNGGGGGGN